MPPANQQGKEERAMTNESFEPVELGQAETLIELAMVEDREELNEKFVTASAPYVEFE